MSTTDGAPMLPQLANRDVALYIDGVRVDVGQVASRWESVPGRQMVVAFLVESEAVAEIPVLAPSEGGTVEAQHYRGFHVGDMVEVQQPTGDDSKYPSGGVLEIRGFEIGEGVATVVGHAYAPVYDWEQATPITPDDEGLVRIPFTWIQKADLRKGMNV